MAFGNGPFHTAFGTGPRRRGHATPVVVQPYIVRIGSLDVVPVMAHNTMKFDEALNGRDTLSFDLIVDDGYLPSLGERVFVIYGNVRMWAGLVHEYEASYTRQRQQTMTTISIRCVDMSALTDRITANKIYDNMMAGDIVRDLIATYLTADGITDGGVQDGPSISRAVFARKPIANCLDDLSRLTGYHWTVDEFLVMQFFPKFAAISPLTINEGNATCRDARASKTLDQFANVQYINGANGITVPMTETYIGDGITRAFPTVYPLASLIEVRVNGQLQTQGIRSVDDDGSKQFYWNKNQQGINQDNNQTLLQDTDRVAITYTGIYGPVATKLVNNVAVMARQAVEGGSGRYESVDSDQQVDGLDIAIAKARGNDRRYGSLDDNVTFETDIHGLAIGQTVTVDMPRIGLANKDMLITAVSTSLFALGLNRYNVTATTGELKGTYQEFFQKFFTRGVPVTITPDDIINEVAIVNDALSAGDFITITSGAAHTAVWGVDDWGYAEC